MTTWIFDQNPGKAAWIFGLLAMTVYLMMILGTLAQIQAVSGLPALDMRPFGYGRAEVEELLSALGPDGRHVYLARQIPLDMLYPALFALTLVSALRWCSAGRSFERVAQIGMGFAVLAALCDYCENLGIVAMILTWPDLPQTLVSLSALTTVCKSLLTTVAIVFVFGCGVFRLCQRRTHPPASAGPPGPG